jgi:hypothetical protein
MTPSDTDKLAEAVRTLGTDNLVMMIATLAMGDDRMVAYVLKRAGIDTIWGGVAKPFVQAALAKEINMRVPQREP